MHVFFCSFLLYLAVAGEEFEKRQDKKKIFFFFLLPVFFSCRKKEYTGMCHLSPIMMLIINKFIFCKSSHLPLRFLVHFINFDEKKLDAAAV